MDINFGSKQFEFPIAEQYKGLESVSECALELFYWDFFQVILSVPLDPSIHLITIEFPMVNLPVSSSNFAVDGQRRIVSVEFELIGRYVQELKTLEQLIVWGNKLFKGLIFRGVDIAIEDDCDVFGSYFLQELLFFLDHEGSGYSYGEEKKKWC